MNINFRFGVVSDLHIALPHTIENNPHRFHMVEISTKALEKTLQHFESLNLDFILIPGDLTQDGEIDNHKWLVDRLKKLPFPAYVIPGNHDVINLLGTEKSIGFYDFPNYYQDFGYKDTKELYYTQEILPGVQLVALNSNLFDSEGKQQGRLDTKQIEWLEKTLEEVKDKFILLTVHHNAIEHLPGQSIHPLGKRYMLDNSALLLDLCQRYGVNLIFTGHLHVQDIAEKNGIYEICTGSMVSYPHPYRVLEIQTKDNNDIELKVESYRVKSVAQWETLEEDSRELLSSRSPKFIERLLTSPPLNISSEEVSKYLPQLRYFWTGIAGGDAVFNFPNLPEPVRTYLEMFGVNTVNGKPNLIDNQASLIIKK